MSKEFQRIKGASNKSRDIDALNTLTRYTDDFLEHEVEGYDRHDIWNHLWKNRSLVERAYKETTNSNDIAWKPYDFLYIETGHLDDIKNKRVRELLACNIEFQNTWIRGVSDAWIKYNWDQTESSFNAYKISIEHAWHQILKMEHHFTAVISVLESDVQQPEQREKTIDTISLEVGRPLKTEEEVQEEFDRPVKEITDAVEEKLRKDFTDNPVGTIPDIEWIAKLASYASEIAPIKQRQLLFKLYTQRNMEQFDVVASKPYPMMKEFKDEFSKFVMDTLHDYYARQLERLRQEHIMEQKKVDYNTWVKKVEIEHKQKIEIEMVKQKHLLERQKLMSSILNKQYLYTVATFLILGANQGAMVAGDGVTRGSAAIVNKTM
jgi:hypothetical protein